MTCSSTTITRVAGMLGAGALALTLAACSGGQSVAEACQIAQDSVAEAGEQINSLMAEAISGGGSMKDLIAPLNEAIEGAEAKVTNPEVLAALEAMNSEFTSLGELLEGIDLPDMQGTDPENPTATPEQLKAQEELAAISGEIEERSLALEAADTRLQELCGS